MNKILSHFSATPKSLGAAIGGALTIAALFGYLPKEKAEGLTIAIAPILALLIPDRKGSTPSDQAVDDHVLPAGE